MFNFKSILARCIRSAKKSYFHTQLQICQSDVNKTWNILNELLKNRSDSALPSDVNINGHSITDIKSIAQEFNKYFSEIGTTLASKINTSQNSSYKHYLTEHFPCTFTFKNVTEEDIVNIFNDLHSKKSSGHDSISAKLLKQLQPTLIKSLVIIINQCSGIFPDQLKLAKVIPVFKKGNKKLLENYRPISILPSISKIFEKVVFNQLTGYLESNNLLHPNQYGFRKKCSTEHAILHLTDRIISEMDQCKTPITFFLDLSKAFDTLDTEILIKKLKYYGVMDTSLKWFESYLTNRKQYVEYNNTKSTILDINTGVPQGSILGPLLFIIYTNDIKNISDSFEKIFYADDTSLLNTLINLNKQEDIKELEKQLDSVYEWLTVNKLTLNISKTKFMIFSSKNKNINIPNIVLNNQPIENVSEFSFLGVTLSEHMSWRNHTDKISNKINRIVGLLHRLKHFLPLVTLKTLYYSLIFPHFNYGSIAWGSDTSRLFKIQKKAIRAITNSKYNAHTDPLFKSLNILKIDDLIKVNTLKFYFKLIHNDLPPYFNSITVNSRSELHDYNTRNKDRIHINATSHKFAENCIRNQIPIILNETPSIVLQKVYTHSYKGFVNYAKNFTLQLYQTECHIDNCFVCSNSGY